MFNAFQEKFEELNREKCREMRKGSLTKEQYEQWQTISKEIWRLAIDADYEFRKEKCPIDHKLITEEEVSFRRGYHHGFCVAQNRPDVTEKQIHDWRHSEENTQWPPGSPMLRPGLSTTKLD